MHDRLDELEPEMWAASIRGDRRWMAAHPSPTFTGFGRACARAEILDLPTGDIQATITGRTVREVSPGAALETCRSDRGGEQALRASSRVRHDDRRLLELHRGTPSEP